MFHRNVPSKCSIETFRRTFHRNVPSQVYSTHVTVGELTWRYVVGVQLSSDYNVTARDLAMPLDPLAQYRSYRYDDSTTFKPTSMSELQRATAERVVSLRKSDDGLCATAPAFNITTRCFPFQWHAVAPVAGNGWVLTGEVGKLVPISNQRLARVTPIEVGRGGGFELVLKGMPGERVVFGAADTRTGTIKYEAATIASDGVAKLQIG